MERAAFDRMNEIDSKHWWFVARRRIINTLLTYYASPSPMRLLEIGAGTGSNLAMLQKFGSVDAVEPDNKARAVAAARSGIAVQAGYLPHGVMLPDGAYDTILLLDVLEHIEDDLGTLKMLKSKLAPGGRLLLTVPSAPWMWSGHDVEHHHYRRYSAGQLKDVLASAGFAVRHCTHYNSLLYPLIALMRIVGKISKKQGGDDVMPSPMVNSVLERIFGAERLWIARLKVPFGVSLAAIAEPD
jgi:SAM-dependent methyltransferase